MAIKVSNGQKTFEVDESNLSAAEKDGFVPTIKVSNGKLEHDVHPSKLEMAQKDGFKPLTESRKALAALEGFGEGATLGYLNNLQALAEKPITAIGNLITGNDVEADDYVTARDKYNKRQETLQKENPGSFGVGQVAGTLVSSIPVARAAQGATMAARAIQAAKAGAAYGALQNTSEQEGEMGGLDVGERAKNAAFGAATGAGASLGVDALGKGLRAGANAIASGKNKAGVYLKESAEKLAENATGATGVQSAKFEKGAGRQLLDRGLVKFGDTAEKVAERVGKAQDDAGAAIGKALKELDDQGVTASIDNVVKKLELEIADLNKTAGNEKLIKQIQGEIDNLYSRGDSKTLISLGEESKRNFQGRTNYNNPDMIDQQASAKVADAFKNEVEDAALAANKNLGGAFKESKETYSLLNPIREASERRASQLKQSPLGGLLDVTGAVAGGAVGGIPGAVAGSVGRRAVMPRLSSSLAVTFDGISKKLLQQPQMARLAQVNPEAFKATVFSLVDRMSEKSQGIGSALPKAADSEAPKKGPDKWVLDGIDKLNQAGISRDDLEALKSTTQGRKLLIEASDAKPNSKLMESVLKRIRSASLNGGE